MAAHRERRWLPPLVVFLVLVAVVFGGYFLAGVLSVPAGPAVVVGSSVAVAPLSGWTATPLEPSPVTGVPAERISRGTGTLDVLAPIPARDPTDLLKRYVSNVLETASEQLRVSEDIQTRTLPSGASAARVRYDGMFTNVPTRIEGELTAVVSPNGTGVIFDGWGPEGLFGYALRDIRQMVAGSEIV
ncbi:MAG: hypothetical protein WD004_04410 [Actinomycetota bacterium]